MADNMDDQNKSGSRPASAKSGGSRPASAAKSSGSRPASAKSKEAVGDVVSAITVKALQDMDTGDMPAEETKPSSRPASAAKSGSRPASAKTGSRPPSAKPASRPVSAVKTSRPGSAAEKSPSKPPSGTASPKRPGSASKPGSGAASPVERPSSAAKPASGAASPAERPASATKPPSGKTSPVSVAKDSPRGSKAGSQRGGSAGSKRGPEHTTPAPPPSGRSMPDDEDDLVNDDFGGLPATEPTSRGGGGDSDGDDDGDDYDNDDSYDDDDEEEESEPEEESELVVLDPDHPLMKRFQKALKDHLEKQEEKITLELRELEEALRKRRTDREDIGVELYGVQQELARHQMQLEQKHDSFSQLEQNRQQLDIELYEVRDLYKDKQFTTNTEKKKVSDLQQEVENLALRIFFMKNAKDDVRSDISVMRRAAEKAEGEVSKIEVAKQKQDLYVDRLVERVDKLKEEIGMFEAQIAAQSEETKDAREALFEAQLEIETISMEKKQLFQQWSSSLIGMRRRDEAHAAMTEALHQQQQIILSLETEIEGYKKAISKEQEQNEKLTLILNKTEIDIQTVKKQLQACQAKHEILKSEYATYTRMLHETEQALNRATTDKTVKENEVSALRKQIEREYQEKVKLEDEIMEKLRSQLTMDKAAQYTDKLAYKIRNKTKSLEAQVAQVENEIAKDVLSVSNTKTRVKRLGSMLKELDEEIRQKNDIIGKSETEIVRRNAIIERKQGIIDQFNKKLEQMIANAGGVEIGPLEIQVNSLSKSIDARHMEIAELQQIWLREQNELVKLTKEKDVQTIDVVRRKKQLTILTQKKIRIEKDIDQQNVEIFDTERNIRNMHNEMIKLNQLFHKEHGTHDDLIHGTTLMENDFIVGLKEAEHESISMQEELESIKEEKERLLNSLIESERQIMLWEKKIQLGQETRQAVDSEVGQGEMRAMKAEIHRMSVRYSQLMRQQEKMIQEMEKSVSRRDTIVTRGDAQQKMNKKVITKGTFQRQLQETKKKVKITLQDANNCDLELKELRENQQEISSGLEEKQIVVQTLQSQSDTLDGDLERLMEQKHKNMTDLLSRQQKAKYYQQLKDGRYSRICKTDESLEVEMNKQQDRMQTLAAIVDRLNQEYPHIQPALRKVTLALESRGIPLE